MKLTNSFHSRLRIQGGNINFIPENCDFLSQKLQFLAKRKTTCLEKITPIFRLSEGFSKDSQIFSKFKNLSDTSHLTNQLCSAGRLKFTYFCTNTYFSQLKSVKTIHLNL